MGATSIGATPMGATSMGAIPRTIAAMGRSYR